MGTLFDQPDRQRYLGNGAIPWLLATMRDNGFDPKKRDDVHAFCELMRTALAIQSADVLDEQLAGFGEILQSIVSAINDLQEPLRSDHPLQGETFESLAIALEKIADAIGEAK